MTTARFTTVLTASTLLTLLASGFATAQVPKDTPVGLTVTASVADGSRMLEVTDTGGGSIQGIALAPGQPSPFRVKVTDTASTDPADALTGFTVTSSMTQLYQQTAGVGTPETTDDTYSYAVDTALPSATVNRGFTVPQPAVSSLLANVAPVYTLAESTLAGPCATLDAATELICDSVKAALDLLDPATIDDAGITQTGGLLTDVDLSSLAPGDLPIAPADDLAPGAYTAPNCVDGLASADAATADCAGAAADQWGTQQKLLDAPLNPVSDALRALLETASPALEVTATDGSAAFGPTELIGLLDAVDPTITAPLKLAGVTVDQQVAVLNVLFDMTHTGSLQDIIGLTGDYTGFPSLTFTAPAGADGTYGGTLTVVLVDCPPCSR